MTDRYVIVYRDGYYGDEMTRAASNNLLKRSRMRAILEADRPAYRIRIREKAPPAPKFEFKPYHLSDPVPDSVMQI